MAFDYSELAEISEELITEFGRNITLVELVDVAATPSKPWLGAASPRGAPKQTVTVVAVVVEPSSLNVLGNEFVSADFLKRASKIAIVYSETALTAFDEVIDSLDSSRWKVTDISTLQPGPSAPLLHYVGLSR